MKFFGSKVMAELRIRRASLLARLPALLAVVGLLAGCAVYQIPPNSALVCPPSAAAPPTNGAATGGTTPPPGATASPPAGANALAAPNSQPVYPAVPGACGPSATTYTYAPAFAPYPPYYPGYPYPAYSYGPYYASPYYYPWIGAGFFIGGHRHF